MASKCFRGQFPTRWYGPDYIIKCVVGGFYFILIFFLVACEAQTSKNRTRSDEAQINRNGTHFDDNRAYRKAVAELKGLHFYMEGNPVTILRGSYVDLHSDEALAPIRNLTQLQEVQLQSWGEITGASLSHLSDLKKLVKLNVAENRRIDDTGMIHLKDLAKLRILDVQATSIGDTGLSAICHLVGLEVLFVGETRITDKSMLCLERLIALRELGIEKTKVTDRGLKSLSKLTRLEKLGSVLALRCAYGFASQPRF